MLQLYEHTRLILKESYRSSTYARVRYRAQFQLAVRLKSWQLALQDFGNVLYKNCNCNCKQLLRVLLLHLAYR